MDLVLHLGMSKTGTTYLQEEVFPRLTWIEYFDRPTSETLRGGKNQGLLARAFRRSPAIWDDIGDDLLEEVLRRSKGNAGDTTVLVSDQSAGPQIWQLNPYLGSRWEQERQDPFLLKAHLQQISKVAQSWGFGSLRILLIFRRQDTWIASKYAQRSDRFPNPSQSHFERYVDYLLNPEDGFYSDGIVLDYHKLLHQIRSAVGSSNVLMIPFELLKHDARMYLEQIVGFVDHTAEPKNATTTLVRLLAQSSTTTKRNVRSARANMWALRRRRSQRSILPQQVKGRLRHAERLWQRTVRSSASKRRRYIELTREMSDRILDVYAESNRRLAREIDVDLSRYGYFASC